MSVGTDTWWQDYLARNAEKQEARKANIILLMQERGVVKIRVTASGSGDEGNIDDAWYYDAAGKEVEVDWRDPLSDAVDDFLCNDPEVNFNNDGCEAELTIDMSAPEGEQFAMEIAYYETVAVSQPRRFV